MSAYFIARVEISDREKYKEYLAAVPAIIRKYDGKVLSRTEECITLEGPAENRRIIIIEFPSTERAEEFYDSVDYREARKLREHAAMGEIIIAGGL